MMAQSRVLSCSDFSLPLLFGYAGNDVISNPSTNQHIQQADKTVLCRNEDSHEVLNEIDRKDLYETISAWILQRAVLE